MKEHLLVNGMLLQLNPEVNDETKDKYKAFNEYHSKLFTLPRIKQKTHIKKSKTGSKYF